MTEHFALVRPASGIDTVRLTAEAKHAGRTLQVLEVTSWNGAGNASTITCQVAS